MKFLKTASLLLAASVALGACSEGDVNNYSPEQVIENALQQTEKASRYYGEATLTLNDTTMHIKEWHDGENRRVEVTGEGEEAISVLADGKMTTYDKKSNSVYTFSMGEDAETLPSPQQTAENMLNIIKDTHEVKLIGEEQVIGRDTYHIQARETKETLFGNQDFWIDKETWVILQAKSQTGDTETTTVYTKFDTKPKMSDDLFTIDIPKDAKVEVIEEEPEETITLAEAQAIYPQLLTVKEEAAARITKLTSAKGEPEITFEYEQAGMSVSIFKDTTTEEDTAIPGDTEVDVLGQKAQYTELGDFKLLNFAKDGLRYSIMPTSEATQQQIIAFANQLES